MKLVLFQRPGGAAEPGLLTERGIVGLGGAVTGGGDARLTMQGLIDDFAALRPTLDRLAINGPTSPAETVRLLPPLPWPGKILSSTGEYGKPAEGEPAPLLLTLKSGNSVIGPGD